jgi:hypothetical protein
MPETSDATINAKPPIKIIDIRSREERLAGDFGVETVSFLDAPQEVQKISELRNDRPHPHLIRTSISPSNLLELAYLSTRINNSCTCTTLSLL